MKILSYRVDDHDSNFCYYNDGDVKYYSPERDFQVKHYGYEPIIPHVKFDNNTADQIFEIFSVNPEEIDIFVGIPDDPPAKGVDGKYWVDPKLTMMMSNNIFGVDTSSYIVEHHWAHAQSVWPISTDVEYSIVYDGVGSEGIFASIFHNSNRIVHLKRPDSTSFCFEFCELGHFCNMQGLGLDLAGKVMGYQSFGDKKHAKKIFSLLNKNFSLETIPDVKTLVSHLEEYSKQTVCMAYQMFVEDSFIEWVTRYVPINAKVSLTGGLGQNVLLNYKLSKVYKNLIIPPHVNDCGLSIGALKCITDHYDLPMGKIENFPFCQFDESPTETPTKETIATIASLLSKGKIVAMYQGNGEVGPRALGNRSILMDPTIENGKDVINERVKKRESYRPFGAAVMLEHVSDWFEWEGETPYMLHAVPVKKNSIKSVTHVDGTSRIQTVKDGIMYELLDEFNKITNVPVLLNTSLNLAGKPIAGTISDAKKLFEDVDIDILCYGNTILYK